MILQFEFILYVPFRVKKKFLTTLFRIIRKFKLQGFVQDLMWGDWFYLLFNEVKFDFIIYVCYN